MSEHITSAHVINAIPLTPQLVQVTLAPTHFISYEAGQYLQLLSKTHAPLSYSIANAPHASQTYELHIRHSQDTPKSEALIHELSEHKQVTLQLPFGQCTLRALNPTQPILFIAGGTGFAPIKAMIEQLIAEKQTRPVSLYWSARSLEELYLNKQALTWAKQHAWFTYYSRTSENTNNSISSLILNHHKHNLATHQIVLAGPFDMVYSLRDELILQGVSSTQLHSDAFAFKTS